MDQWYYIKNGITLGPVSFEDLRKLVSSSDLLPNDLVFKDQDKRNTQAMAVPGLFADNPGDELEQIKVFPPTYMNREKEKRENTKWMLIGGLGLSIGVVLLLLTSQKIIPTERINRLGSMNAEINKKINEAQIEVQKATKQINKTFGNLNKTFKDMNLPGIPNLDNLKIPGIPNSKNEPEGEKTAPSRVQNKKKT